MTQRVGIITSGGDAPGMNAAIRASAMLVRASGGEIIGFKDGYEGLIENEWERLDMSDVDDIERQGGTILGSARCPEFHERAGRRRAREVLDELEVDGLLVIGGNGSLTGLDKLLNDPDKQIDPPSAIGIPASIDNDLGWTGICIGVDTAMNTIVEACDKIGDTARAFDRTFLVEVMGRECGYLAMTSGIAAGAETVLFPESNANEEQLVDKVVRAAKRAAARQDRPKGALVVKAEGCDVPTDRLKELVDSRLDEELDDAVPDIETRVTVLGHVVRGGRPSAFDRLVASRLANAAVEGLFNGHTDKMTAWLHPHPFPEGVAVQSSIDPYCWLVDLDEVLEETERIRKGESPLTKWRVDVFNQIEDVLAS